MKFQIAIDNFESFIIHFVIIKIIFCKFELL